MVIKKDGGPWSLYCTDCHTWFPNTANAEMQKEGAIAYSHVCGVNGADEITDKEFETMKKDKKQKHILVEVVERDIEVSVHESLEKAQEAMKDAFDFASKHSLDFAYGPMEAYVNDGPNHDNYDWKIIPLEA